MKRKIISIGSLQILAALFILSGCQKLLDKKPITQIVATGDSTQITATDAENLITGAYTSYKGYDFGLEFNVFDRIVNGDVVSDNAYAGGDNTANITLDLFTTNSLNGNMDRDWRDAFGIIGRINITIDQVQKCIDPALTADRKNEILGESRFMRAFTYFDLVRLFGRVPLILQAANTKSAEDLYNSTILPQSSTDSVYMAILQDLWYARSTVRPVDATPSKFVVSRGTVTATLAKVYASMPTPNWDSVSYYCDQTIPSYTMVTDFNTLWDNNHKNNSEAIWELNYDGYSTGDFIGNWIPSINVGGKAGDYEGGGWKKFNTPTNDLVNAFLAENDNIRLNASITFLDVSGQWSDAYWGASHYPFLTKFNDPANGTNDFYMIRLPDILLLKAEALVKAGNINGAMDLVNMVRARVSLSPKTAADATTAESIIANERRLELAFEGHRWFDLLRTGKALEVMNAQKDGAGNNLNYHVQDFRLLMPIPQPQIDLNPLLTQNPNY